MTSALLTPLLALFAAACGMSLILTPVARLAARRCGFVDRPDGRRKLHVEAVPLAGGLAILAAGTLALLLAFALPGPLAAALAPRARTLAGLLLGALVIADVGVADDFRLLRSRHKLLGQVVAALIVMGSGVRIDHLRLFGWDVNLGALAVPFTLFWLLGAINALNLLDGMDGLLSSVGLIVSLTLAVMAGMERDWAGAAVAVALAGSVLGFLHYNLPPARIFLGDCGSMLIGLVVGVLAIQSSLKGPATVALAAPAALFILPILDTAAAIVRRKLTGRSIYTTDRGHLHHCLQHRGLSSRGALLVVAGLSLVAAGGALASLVLNSEVLAVLAAVSVATVLVVTRLFGRAELMLVQKRVASVAAALLARSGRSSRELSVRLHGSADWAPVWLRLTELAERLNLQSVRLAVNAPALMEEYHARWERAGESIDERPLWRVEVPLADGGQSVGRVEITGRPDDESVALKLASVARLLADVEATLAHLALRRRAPAPDAPRPRAAAPEPATR
ncbi:MAG TPA: MraY family glycosyltransferase [Gemmataceae bacterium]|nr:MraY family glycosyltransferase [Gemmataceae bacterium]